MRRNLTPFWMRNEDRNQEMLPCLTYKLVAVMHDNSLSCTPATRLSFINNILTLLFLLLQIPRTLCMMNLKKSSVVILTVTMV